MHESAMDVPPQPQSHSQWASSTQANITRAAFLARDVLDRLRQNEADDHANKQALEAGLAKEKERVRVKVKSKVKAHTEVINGSARQMKEIEEALVQAEGVQSRLVHERYARYAALKVCEYRLELRKARPAKENFRDATEEALDRERQLLIAARKQLLDGEAACQRAHDEIGAIRTELSRDTGTRRLAMHHDMAALRPKLEPSAPGDTMLPTDMPLGSAAGGFVEQQYAPAAASASAAPALDAAPEQRRQLDAGVGEPVSKAQAQQYIQRSMELVQSVYDLKQRSEQMIVKIREDSAAALKRVNECMSRRTKELAEMKKKCEKSVLDVDHARAKAERALQAAEERLDPAGGDKAQQERVAVLRMGLADLVSHKRHLQEDLRNKIDALNIDNSCRRCTPQIACEPEKPKQSGYSTSPTQQSYLRSTNGEKLAEGRSFYKANCMGPGDFGDGSACDSTASTATTATGSTLGSLAARGLGKSSSSPELRARGPALRAAAGLMMPGGA